MHNDQEVYVVYEQNFDGCEVKAIFSRKDLAEEASKLFCCDWERWSLDQPIDRIPGCYLFSVAVTLNGEVKSAQPYPVDGSVNNYSNQMLQPVKYSIAGSLRFGRVAFWIWAETRELAIEKALEIRLQLIAKGEWPTKEN